MMLYRGFESLAADVQHVVIVLFTDSFYSLKNENGDFKKRRFAEYCDSLGFIMQDGTGLPVRSISLSITQTVCLSQRYSANI